MMKKNILASNVMFLSCAHKNKYIEQYKKELDLIFTKIGDCVNNNLDINTLLESPVCHSGFKRLN